MYFKHFSNEQRIIDGLLDRFKTELDNNNFKAIGERLSKDSSRDDYSDFICYIYNELDEKDILKYAKVIDEAGNIIALEYYTHAVYPDGGDAVLDTVIAKRDIRFGWSSYPYSFKIKNLIVYGGENFYISSGVEKLHIDTLTHFKDKLCSKQGENTTLKINTLRIVNNNFIVSSEYVGTTIKNIICGNSATTIGFVSEPLTKLHIDNIFGDTITVQQLRKTPLSETAINCDKLRLGLCSIEHAKIDAESLSLRVSHNSEYTSSDIQFTEKVKNLFFEEGISEASLTSTTIWVPNSTKSLNMKQDQLNLLKSCMKRY